MTCLRVGSASEETEPSVHVWQLVSISEHCGGVESLRGRRDVTAVQQEGTAVDERAGLPGHGTGTFGRGQRTGEVLVGERVASLGLVEACERRLMKPRLIGDPPAPAHRSGKSSMTAAAAAAPSRSPARHGHATRHAATQGHVVVGERGVGAERGGQLAGEIGETGLERSERENLGGRSHVCPDVDCLDGVPDKFLDAAAVDRECGASRQQQDVGVVPAATPVQLVGLVAQSQRVVVATGRVRQCGSEPEVLVVQCDPGVDVSARRPSSICWAASSNSPSSRWVSARW